MTANPLLCAACRRPCAGAGVTCLGMPVCDACAVEINAEIDAIPPDEFDEPPLTPGLCSVCGKPASLPKGWDFQFCEDHLAFVLEETAKMFARPIE